jgi:hypothetical protein
MRPQLIARIGFEFEYRVPRDKCVSHQYPQAAEIQALRVGFVDGERFRRKVAAKAAGGT